MINFVASKKNNSIPQNENIPNDSTIDKDKTVEDEKEQDEIPILCAKWVYNSYFKINSLNKQQENFNNVIKKLKKEQIDSKSSYNLTTEVQKKAESDKLLNWRAERNNNENQLFLSDQSFPMIRSNNAKMGAQLNSLLTPKAINMNSLSTNNWLQNENSLLVKELIRKNFENMSRDEL